MKKRRRISLGIKQCQSNPWQEFADKHQEGGIVEGAIKSVTDFGIFIGLEGNIDGLIHLNDISWAEPGEKAIRNYKKGDEIKAIVLSADPERERISLGIKQLDSDPVNEFMKDNLKGTVVSGTVTAVDAKAATVTLAENV